MQQGRARRSRKRSHLRSHRGHRPAETPIALPTGNAVLSAANAADDGGAGGAVPGNGPALQGGCQDPRWRIAEEGPGETGPVSITDGNSIPRSAIPFYSHNAESARVVTVPKAEPMARRLSCSACPATAVQGFPARPAPAQTARFARTGYERLSGCGGVAAASRESGSLVLCDILVVLRVQDCQKNLRGAGPGRGLQARPAARISSPGWRDPSVVCLQETSTAARPVNVTRFRTRYGWPVTVSRPGQGSCRPGTGTMPRLGSGR